MSNRNRRKMYIRKCTPPETSPSIGTEESIPLMVSLPSTLRVRKQINEMRKKQNTEMRAHDVLGFTERIDCVFIDCLRCLRARGCVCVRMALLKTSACVSYSLDFINAKYSSDLQRIDQIT